MKMENFDGKKSIRRGGTALYITLAAAFLLIAVFLAMALFFKITDITVEGSEKYDDKTVIEASGVEKDGSIFFLNASEAQIAIKSALPYIDTVKITRNLPGTVTITVTESAGAAYLASGGSFWIIDTAGRVLERTDTAPAGLVEVRGAAAENPREGESLRLGQGEDARLRGLLDTLSAIEKAGRLNLTTSLDVTNLSAVTFAYNGYKVNIGEANDFDAKFEILDNVFAKYTAQGSGQSVVYQSDGTFRYVP